MTSYHEFSMSILRLALKSWAILLLLSVGACMDRQIVFPPVLDAKTRGYCGTCHMAFQPSMLPTGSWQLMMQNLDNHFDENIKLAPDVIRHITDYHVSNAGNQKTAGKAGQIALQGLRPDARPQRITDTPYFKNEHNFLENTILEDWVGSAANCPVCHVGAWIGDYRI
jgi:hypothetical protein